MTRNTYVTEKPVVLEGFQAVLKPSQFGSYTLSAIIDQELVDKLEDERPNALKWCEPKLKNAKRAVLKPEPWEEKAEGKYKITFYWDDKAKPPVVDSEGTPITDDTTPLWKGSKVKLAFYQKPYVLRDNVTYGTTLKLKAIQVIAVAGQAGVDIGDMSVEDAGALFGKTEGYKLSEPNVVVNNDTDDMEDDF
jgi:hypothetical protein